MAKINMYNDQPKPWKKSDYLATCGIAIMLIFFGVFLNEFKTITVIIALIAAALIIVFYFAKTVTKEVLTEYYIKLNSDITVIFSCVICNLLIAIYKGTTVLKTIAIFAIITVLSSVVSILLSLLINIISKNSKNANKTLNKTFNTIFAFCGVLLGRFINNYLRSKGIEIPLDIVIYILDLVLMITYVSNLIKLKQSEKKSNTDN